MDKKADPQTQLMIDEAILDYLMYTAIDSLLHPLDPDSVQKSHAQLPLHLVDSFISVFRSLHHDHVAPVEIRFRLRLLRFTYVFTQHCHPPAASFPSVTGQPHGIIEDRKESVAEHSSPEQQDTMSLQETLPLFLALSAVQNALQESTITELWMRLAAGYIALSYVEQVLIYNIDHPGLLERFFRWGYEADCDAEENSDEWYINKMFGADESVVRLWEEIKEEHMQAASSSSPSYLEYLLIRESYIASATQRDFAESAFGLDGLRSTFDYHLPRQGLRIFDGPRLRPPNTLADPA
ncbi:MAG: hypothetical protein Q9200_002833 [Gallowayella weberi]